MKRLLFNSIFLVSFFLFHKTNAQNLVPNPSFEEFNYNDNYLGNIPGAPKYWEGLLSPDWFHINNVPPPVGPNTGVGIPANFAGNQLPNTGLGYAGFYNYLKYSPESREMVYVGLTDSLSINKNYCATFYINLADTSVYSNSLMSATFITDTMYFYNLNPPNPPYWHYYFTPQVTNNTGFLSSKTDWMKVEGSFTADSAYKYIIIGEFSNVTVDDTLHVPGGDQNYPNPYAYYYLDDVSVTEIKNARAGNDTILLNGADTVYLGQNFDDNAFYEWWPNTGIADTNAANPIAFVEQNTTYYVKKTQCNVVSYDTVVITVIPNSINENEIYSGFKISPNPNKGNFVIKNVTGKNINGTLEIYNAYGELIQKDEVQTIKDVEVELKTKTTGVYFLKLLDIDCKTIYRTKFILVE